MKYLLASISSLIFVLGACAAPSESGLDGDIDPNVGGQSPVENGGAGETGGAGKSTQGGNAGQQEKAGDNAGGSSESGGNESGGDESGGKSGNYESGGKGGNYESGGKGGNYESGGKGGNYESGGKGGNYESGGKGGGGVISKEPCCVAHDGPGCMDKAVQDCVCAKDATCCSGSWNQYCVNEIDKFSCGSCSTGSGGTGGKGGSGGAGGKSGSGGSTGATPQFGGVCCGESFCDVPSVESCVCNQDDFCCGDWDDICAEKVESLGCGVCSGKYNCTDYPDQCVDCCTSLHFSGRNSFGTDVSNCACSGTCTSACKAACNGGDVSTACEDCLNENLGGACKLSACNLNPDCKAYLDCVNPCP